MFTNFPWLFLFVENIEETMFRWESEILVDFDEKNPQKQVEFWT